MIRYFPTQTKKRLIFLCFYVTVAMVSAIFTYSNQGYRFFGMLCALLITTRLYVVILKNWRRGIYALLIYLPFAGLPTILLYPAPRITLLIKDLLFVIPAYLGFILWWHSRNRHNRPVLFPNRATIPLALLVGLLFVQFFNPNLINPLVGLIGLKVWLFYVPLFFLAYHFVDSKEELFKVLKVLFFLGLLPVLVGIIQAVFVYSGYSELAYRIYGPAAAAVTQNFATLGIDCVNGKNCNAWLVRTPSIFTFVAQYWLFLLTMYPLGYAIWMKANQQKNRFSQLYLALLGLVIVAACSSGSRAALVLTPFYFLLVAIISGKLQDFWKPIFLLAGGFVVMAMLLGISTNILISYTIEVLAFYLGREGMMSELFRALDTTLLGAGVGMSTGPARYAFNASDAVTQFGALESFYAKTIVELGVLGLIIVVILLGVLLWNGYRCVICLKDPILRHLGVALLALLLVSVIYLAKGAMIDYDPLNVYFWLYAGILMKLPKLEIKVEVER